MSTNDRQVGGKHYLKEYQHWDMVIDTKMPYLPGCATKYVARWKDKNGTEDLLKSMHYLEKATERCVYTEESLESEALVFKFANQLETREQDIVVDIYKGFYVNAINAIRELIEEHDAAEPGPGYVNQG